MRDCGENDVGVLEFDHVGAKTGDIGALVAVGCSLDRLRAELEACEVVCVNCHRRRTTGRRPSWRVDPSLIDRSMRSSPGEKRNMHYVREVLMRSRCVDCGCGDLVVLEFDHLGEKRGNVTVLAREGGSLAVLIEEIERCVVRCGNCHRRRTRASLAARCRD